MDFKRDGNRLLVRLHTGEEIMQIVQQFAQEQKIKNAAVIGIGAAENLDLGYWDREKREYARRQFADPHELLSLSGNLSWRDGSPFLHAHVLLANRDFAVTGGHLFAATITATAELQIWPGELELRREMDESVGMKLWDLCG